MTDLDFMLKMKTPKIISSFPTDMNAASWPVTLNSWLTWFTSASSACLSSEPLTPGRKKKNKHYHHLHHHHHHPNLTENCALDFSFPSSEEKTLDFFFLCWLVSSNSDDGVLDLVCGRHMVWNILHFRETIGQIELLRHWSSKSTYHPHIQDFTKSKTSLCLYLFKVNTYMFVTLMFIRERKRSFDEVFFIHFCPSLVSFLSNFAIFLDRMEVHSW